MADSDHLSPVQLEKLRELLAKEKLTIQEQQRLSEFKAHVDNCPECYSLL